MKKEELIALGVDEEVAKKIMAINGADIENAKAKADKTQEIENLKSQLSEKDKLIEEANVQIENFKGMDVEGTKKAADEWKTKFEQAAAESKTKEEEFKKQLEQQQYDFKLNEYVNGQKFTSDFAKKAYLAELKAQGFKLDADGNFLGANEYTEKFKAANQGVFVAEEAPKETTPEVVLKPTNTQPQGKKMGLMEMMKLKNSNPDAAISFNQE